jgi:hypothetical protein
MTSLEQSHSIPASIPPEVQKPADPSVAKGTLIDDSKEKVTSQRVTAVKPQAGKKQKSRRVPKTMKTMPDNALQAGSGNNSKPKTKSGNNSEVKLGNNKTRGNEAKFQHMKPMGE